MNTEFKLLQHKSLNKTIKGVVSSQNADNELNIGDDIVIEFGLRKLQQVNGTIIDKTPYKNHPAHIFTIELDENMLDMVPSVELIK